MTGGPFKNKMIFKAGKNQETTELRLAYARSWEFDSELLKTATYDTWSSKVWNSKLLSVYVDLNIKKIDLSTLNNSELYTETVNASVGDLIRLSLRETPTAGFHWVFHGASTDEDSSI